LEKIFQTLKDKFSRLHILFFLLTIFSLDFDSLCSQISYRSCFILALSLNYVFHVNILFWIPFPLFYIRVIQENTTDLLLPTPLEFFQDFVCCLGFSLIWILWMLIARNFFCFDFTLFYPISTFFVSIFFNNHSFSFIAPLPASLKVPLLMLSLWLSLTYSFLNAEIIIFNVSISESINLNGGTLKFWKCLFWCLKLQNKKLSKESHD
jgi:hypothetical protein